ncbi:putative protein, PMT family [Campylobacter pinnipediorum subsp. caledonicus]|uniref:Uncharacterized protein n=1 Tax=Campylobacter pinnipediorum subsp. caledonicus TaxID=1874362 RepID=A0A1S6U6L6_9BACT|nr:hypothetical protein [Campylobacter pinnipediorum]AQW87322.1 putative protein, PMT family [Campylobacter pinnipediorum subsp. caledonicus]
MKDYGLKLYSIKNNDIFVLTIICALDLALLIYCTSTLSISYYEALVFFNEQDSILHKIITASCKLFGQNDFALRIPMIFFHIISVILLYKISKFYIKFHQDRIIAILLFVFLPGTVASALIVNNAGLCLMITLFILYFFHKNNIYITYILMASSIFVDSSFMILFLAFFAYGVYTKNATLAWLSAIFFTISLSFFGFDTQGKPSSHFIDTFGIFAAVFSPFIFIFFIYAIYRIWIKEKKDILWFLSVISFCISIVLSIRQKVQLEEFLPFCIIATPLMIRIFFSSYRVRLPEFRKKHKIALVFVFLFLFSNWLIIIFNPVLYNFINNPKKHFAYKFHVAKELSKELSKLNIYEINTQNYKLALRLKFYGISNGGNLALIENNNDFFVKKFDKIIHKL